MSCNQRSTSPEPPDSGDSSLGPVQLLGCGCQALGTGDTWGVLQGRRHPCSSRRGAPALAADRGAGVSVGCDPVKAGPFGSTMRCGPWLHGARSISAPAARAAYTSQPAAAVSLLSLPGRQRVGSKDTFSATVRRERIPSGRVSVTPPPSRHGTGSRVGDGSGGPHAPCPRAPVLCHT